MMMLANVKLQVSTRCPLKLFIGLLDLTWTSDYVHLLTIFVSVVRPNVPPGQTSSMIRYWSEVFPILTKILENFTNFSPICERISRCWRTMLISYRTDMLPLLPALAEKLVVCFEKSSQGCFLWVSGAVVREFVDDELVDEATRLAVYNFLERQCLSMFRIMNGKRPEEIPDGNSHNEIGFMVYRH